MSVLYYLPRIVQQEKCLVLLFTFFRNCVATVRASSHLEFSFIFPPTCILSALFLFFTQRVNKNVAKNIFFFYSLIEMTTVRICIGFSRISNEFEGAAEGLWPDFSHLHFTHFTPRFQSRWLFITFTISDHASVAPRFVLRKKLQFLPLDGALASVVCCCFVFKFSSRGCFFFSF